MYEKRKGITINKYKIIIMLVLVFILVKIISYTISRYESITSSSADLDAAYYILDEDYQTMNVNLGLLVPRNDPYIYTFVIANNDGTNRTDTNMQYDLTIRTTTNLPLQIELYKNENYNDIGSQSIIDETTIEQDEHLTYFKIFTTPTNYFGYTVNEQNTYNLVVYFPSIYNSINYQDIIENIELQIESKQII